MHNLAVAAPFLKWAGGKSRLAAEILALAPPAFGRYHEPFLGAGAVFFAFEAAGTATDACLGDANESLVDCFGVVRHEPERLAERLEALSATYLPSPDDERRRLYYEVRASQPATSCDRAARLIFLNKTCYNGLFRVNRRGQFNVPHGRYRMPAIADRDALIAASAALRAATLFAGDFEQALAGASAGDFVYLDPPYQPLSETANFTSYTRGDFDRADQERLRDAMENLTRRGAAVVLSNSMHPYICELYDGRGFELRTVPMSRAINSRASARTPIPELLISNRLRPEVMPLYPQASTT